MKYCVFTTLSRLSPHKTIIERREDLSPRDFASSMSWSVKNIPEEIDLSMNTSRLKKESLVGSAIFSASPASLSARHGASTCALWDYLKARMLMEEM